MADVDSRDDKTSAKVRISLTRRQYALGMHGLLVVELHGLLWREAITVERRHVASFIDRILVNLARTDAHESLPGSARILRAYAFHRQPNPLARAQPPTLCTSPGCRHGPVHLAHHTAYVHETALDAALVSAADACREDDCAKERMDDSCVLLCIAKHSKLVAQSRWCAFTVNTVGGQLLPVTKVHGGRGTTPRHVKHSVVRIDPQLHACFAVHARIDVSGKITRGKESCGNCDPLWNGFREVLSAQGARHVVNKARLGAAVTVASVTTGPVHVPATAFVETSTGHHARRTGATPESVVTTAAALASMRPYEGALKRVGKQESSTSDATVGTKTTRPRGAVDALAWSISRASALIDRVMEAYTEERDMRLRMQAQLAAAVAAAATAPHQRGSAQRIQGEDGRKKVVVADIVAGHDITAYAAAAQRTERSMTLYSIYIDAVVRLCTIAMERHRGQARCDYPPEMRGALYLIADADKRAWTAVDMQSVVATLIDDPMKGLDSIVSVTTAASVVLARALPTLMVVLNIASDVDDWPAPVDYAPLEHSNLSSATSRLWLNQAEACLTRVHALVEDVFWHQGVPRSTLSDTTIEKSIDGMGKKERDRLGLEAMLDPETTARLDTNRDPAPVPLVDVADSGRGDVGCDAKQCLDDARTLRSATSDTSKHESAPAVSLSTVQRLALGSTAKRPNAKGRTRGTATEKSAADGPSMFEALFSAHARARDANQVARDLHCAAPNACKAGGDRRILSGCVVTVECTAQCSVTLHKRCWDAMAIGLDNDGGVACIVPDCRGTIRRTTSVRAHTIGRQEPHVLWQASTPPSSSPPHVVDTSVPLAKRPSAVTRPTLKSPRTDPILDCPTYEPTTDAVRDQDRLAAFGGAQRNLVETSRDVADADDRSSADSSYLDSDVCVATKEGGLAYVKKKHSDEQGGTPKRKKPRCRAGKRQRVRAVERRKQQETLLAEPNLSDDLLWPPFFRFVADVADA